MVIGGRIHKTRGLQEVNTNRTNDSSTTTTTTTTSLGFPGLLCSSSPPFFVLLFSPVLVLLSSLVLSCSLVLLSSRSLILVFPPRVMFLGEAGLYWATVEEVLAPAWVWVYHPGRLMPLTHVHAEAVLVETTSEVRITQKYFNPNGKRFRSHSQLLDS